MTEVGRSPLEKLILEVKDTEGKSYETLARRAGFGPDGKARITPAGLHKFGTRRIKRALQAQTVTAIALALNVHPDVVRAAVAETLGYRDRVPGQERGYSAAWGLAERIDRVDDDEARGKLLWALERMVRAVEAELAEAEAEETVDEVAAAIEAGVAEMGDDRRDREGEFLDEVLGPGEDDLTRRANGTASA